jgi:glycerol-3-phosphate acyltransferase PlsX
MSKFVLKTIHGIDRPAIASQIPTYKGRVILLDLGANVNCTAVNLYQFALMGSILSKSLHSVRPKVALLNIGQESQKGTEVIKEASNLVANNKDINYIGYIEADKIYDDIADVIVCDGFIGNVALKTSEGLSRFISDIVWQGFNKNFLTKMLGLLTMPVINKIRAKLDVRKYNGASFLGLNGIVIKSHGGADGRAFANAIMRAKHEIETNVIEKLKDEQNKF